MRIGLQIVTDQTAIDNGDTLWLAGSAATQNQNQGNSGNLQWSLEIKPGTPNSAGRCYLERGAKTLLTQGFGSVDLRIDTISQGQ